MGFALGDGDLKGHGVSRADRVQFNVPALAAEGKAAACESIPQGLKPREFSASGGTAEAVPFQNAADSLQASDLRGSGDPHDGRSGDRRYSPSQTERSHALALQLLHRYGVLLRESVAAENVPGGFSAVYDVLKALEESGRIRRGYFVGGLGATQFALPAAVDLLRQLRTEPPLEKPEFVQLAATDPANPYGSILRWPELPVAEEDSESAPRVLTRAAYAEVILRNGRLVAWLKRGNPNLLVFLPAEEPERSQTASGLAHFLCTRGQARMHTHSHDGVLITTLNGQPVGAHFMARFLMDAGFHPGPLGMHLRRILLPVAQRGHDAQPGDLQ
jgi:ATP-dependent Lhr-like helicase